jgi:4-amino-4-deoxy-L-arabinose transferase-like glycosyltransferase
MLGAAALVLVALALRLYGLGQQDLWLDETLAVDEATATVGRWRRALQENTGPVYFGLLRLAIAAGGIGEAAVRVPSAVAGALFVGAIVWAGRAIFTPATGLWAGLVAALSPIHVYYSQEARVYALLTVFLALASAVLWRGLATGAWPWWAGFAGCALAALYSHYLAILPLAAAVLPVALWPSSEGAAVRRRGFGARPPPSEACSRPGSWRSSSWPSRSRACTGSTGSSAPGWRPRRGWRCPKPSRSSHWGRRPASSRFG